MLKNSKKYYHPELADGLTMPTQVKLLATGLGLAAGIACAISLNSPSGGETVSQKEEAYSTEINYALLCGGARSKDDVCLGLDNCLAQKGDGRLTKSLSRRMPKSLHRGSLLG